MKTKSISPNRIAIISILITSLLTLGAAVYSYIGPQRTVTTQIPACVWEKQQCQYIASKDQYRWHVVDSVSCADESKPWLAGGYPGACDPSHTGLSRWQKTTTYSTGTITYDPATVDGQPFCPNPGLNNWCLGGGGLQISSSEPIAGEQIIAIEGTRNGVNFACPNKATCTVPLLEGANDFSYWAVSSFGDTSTMGNASLQQDSQPPQVSGNLNGTPGDNHWFVSDVSLSASADEPSPGSGLATFTCASDGAGEVPYTDPFTVSGDGIHNVVCTATDNAGNQGDSTQVIQIDTTAPQLSLSSTSPVCPACDPADVPYAANDVTSGIADWALALDGTTIASGAGAVTDTYSLADPSLAAGTHTLSLLAHDLAGNENEIETDIEILLPTPTPTETATATLTPTATNTSTGGSETRPHDQSNLGGDVIQDTTNNILSIFFAPSATPSQTNSPVPTTSPTRTSRPSATTRPTTSIGFIAPSRTPTTAPAGALPISIPPGDLNGDELLFGAEATAAVAALTAMVAKKKREEEEAAAEAHKREMEKAEERREAAQEAMKAQNYLQGKALLNQALSEAQQHGKSQAEIAAILQTAQAKGIGSVLDDVKAFNTLAEKREEERARAVPPAPPPDLPPGLSPDAQQAFLHGGTNWIVDNASDLQQAYAAQRKRDEQAANFDADLSADEKLAAYKNTQQYQEYRADLEKWEAAQPGKGINGMAAPARTQSWWEQGLDWIDHHQAEVSLGIGIGVGIAAIVLSGGAATPLVAAAWIAGSAVVAGGAVALGTVSLNAYYNRPLGDNVAGNTLLAAGAAAITSGLAFFIAGGGLQAALYRVTGGVAAYCTANVNICAHIEPVIKGIDLLEEAGLMVKGTVQTIAGDHVGAGETAIELQLEYMDGGVPGNTAAKEMGDQLARLGDDGAELIEKYGDDVVPLLVKYGPDAVDIVGAYGDEGIALLTLYGDDAVDLIGKYGTPAVDLMLAHGDNAIELVRKYGDDVFHALEGGVVRINAKDANEFAIDLAEATGQKIWASPTTGIVYISKSTDNALDASKMLKDAIIRGDEDEIAFLVEMIAQGSTRGSGDRVVLGAWQEGGGYIGEAVDNGGVFFDTGNDVWGAVKDSGIDPWLVNEQFLTSQLESGVDRIDFIGEDIFDVINSPDIKVRSSYRAQEIRWLLENAEKYGYVRVGNSWILP